MKKRTQPAKDLYQQITDQILEALEQGVMPWQKPWDSGWPQMAIPCNGESGRQYSGINVLLLWILSTLIQTFSHSIPTISPFSFSRYLTISNSKKSAIFSPFMIVR